MFGSTPRRIGEFVINHRIAVITMNLLLLGAVLTGLMNRSAVFQAHTKYMATIRNNPLDADSSHVDPPPFFDADYHVYFDDDNPELIAYDHFQDIYAKEDNLIMVLVAKNGDVFTNENLASLKYLTDHAWTVPYVNRVDGMTNFNYTYVDDDDLLVEDFVADLPLSLDMLAEKKGLALSDPLMPHFLISPKGDITQIQLRVIIPKGFPTGHLESRAAVEALVAEVTHDKIREANGQLAPNPRYNPNIEVRLAGTVMLTTAFQEFARKDAQNLLPLMFAFIMIVLTMAIRSFWGTVSPIVLLLTAVVFPIALFVGVLQFSLTNSSTNVVQMLVAVAIADSVHVLAIFYRGLRNGLSKHQAVVFTVEKNFLPCMITSLTTAIGFYCIIFQDIPPFRDLGLFAGTGTVYAFFASVFTLPAFLSLLPFKARQTSGQAIEEYEGRGYERLTAFILRFQKPIRLVALATSIVSVYFIFQIDIDNTSVKYFSEDTEFRRATEYIDHNIIGVNPLEFSFDSGSENGIYDPGYLKKIERFQSYIQEHPEFHITHVSGITDVVKRINKSMHGDDPAFYRIPEQGEVTAQGDTVDAKKLIAQYLLLYQMSLPQGMELTNQIDIRNRSTRVTAYSRSISSFRLLEHVDTINNWLATHIPSVKAIAVGVPVMFGKLMALAIPSMLRSLVISFLFITLVLMLTFKSVRIGLFSMIPNIWPLAIVFGAIGVLGIKVNMSVAVVGLITLGIAVDDTVHYLTKYLRGKHEGRDQQDALLYAFRQVGAPLVFTSVILVAGFGSLTQSQFVLNSDMALYCTIVIALALFADFILLPATILKFDKIDPARQNSREGVAQVAKVAELGQR